MLLSGSTEIIAVIARDVHSGGESSLRAIKRHSRRLLIVSPLAGATTDSRLLETWRCAVHESAFGHGRTCIEVARMRRTGERGRFAVVFDLHVGPSPGFLGNNGCIDGYALARNSYGRTSCQFRITVAVSSTFAPRITMTL